MKKRLFIIGNETHLLNINRYMESHPEGENLVLLVLRSYEGSEEFLSKLKKSIDVKLIDVVYLRSGSLFKGYSSLMKNFLKVKKLSRSYRYFDEVLFTNYFSWFQHFVLNQFQSQQKILVSDGVGILVIANQRLQGLPIPFKAPPFRGNRLILRKVFDISRIEKLKFYSPYKFPISENDLLEVFSYKKSSQKVNPKKIYFIGSPLVERKYISLEEHMDYLKKIKEKYKDCEMTYYAHRREDDEYLKEYSFFGEVIRNKTPFEEKMENADFLPGAILSYLSSVLLNIYQIYPQVTFYYIPLSKGQVSRDPFFNKNYHIYMDAFKEAECQNFREFKLKKLNS